MLAQENVISWPAAIIIMGLVGVAMVFTGWLVIWTAQRAADGKMGRNAIAGIRTKTTRASDEAWMAAHTAGLKPTRLAGWATIASGVAAVVIGVAFSDSDAQRAMSIWTVAIFIGCMVLLGFSGYGAWKGHQAAKAVNESEPAERQP